MFRVSGRIKASARQTSGSVRETNELTTPMIFDVSSKITSDKHFYLCPKLVKGTGKNT